jgi:hypothetical protein
MRLKTCVLTGIAWLYLGLACAQGLTLTHAITKETLQTHVAFLSADSLQGRLTGSRGERLATQYTANILRQLGLEPAGDNGTYFQAFVFTAGISLGHNNSFTIINQHGAIKNLVLNQDWRPLSFSDSKSFASAKLVFAGYGITAPGYDSYHGLNVKNKWVLVFRYEPEKMNAQLRRHLSQYATLRYKAFTARQHGAKGIIFVSGPNAKVKDELIPLSFDTSLTDSGIVAISIKDAIVNELLRNTLQVMQDKLDAGQLSVMSKLSGIKMAGQVEVQRKRRRGRNVLARLRVAPGMPSIIIGAHADHLGRGELSGSRARENEVQHIHPGADDNASGVAIVLETAAVLSDLKAQGRLHGSKNILFAIWSGEELGLLGSTYFIKSIASTRPAITAYINLDMVGRLRDKLVVQGVGSSSKWLELIEQASKPHSISLLAQSDPYLPTDSTAFYLHGVPAINLFTGSHDEYHTPRDKLATLNVKGMQSISKFLLDLILAMDAQTDPIDYKQVSKGRENTRRGFRVYLGTIPDYTSADIAGVKLSGVTKDSPAEQAGLKTNDVIVALAGKNIHDIYDYSYVLSALHADRPVLLVVLRGQTRMKLTIVARSRD